MPRSSDEIEELVCLGYYYLEYKEESQRLLKAYECFSTAAKYGNTDAQSQLCLMYFDPEFEHHNLEKARYFAEKAASHGDGIAAATLGEIYEYGDGVVQNLEQAAYWYEKAVAYGFEYSKKQLKQVNRSLSLHKRRDPIWLKWLPSSKTLAWFIVLLEILLILSAAGAGLYGVYRLIGYLLTLF